MPDQEPAPRSFQIGLYRFDQFFRAARPLGVLGSVDEVKLDVVLDHFGHKAIEPTTRCHDQMKDRRAPLSFLECAPDSLDLATHATDPILQFELFALSVRHVDTLGWIGYRVSYNG
jgi:hypothetical protein